MGKRALGWACMALLLAACNLGPRFANHPRPALTVDRAPFAAAGCPVDAGGWPRCLPDGPLAALGCDTMRPAPDLLGGLDPAYPIAVCEIYPHWHPDDPARSDGALLASGAYILRRGGLWPVYVRYVVYRQGTFEPVETAEALRALYAPIESPEEALSYALAVTGLEALYGLERQPNYVYEGQVIEDTHVTPVADGYRLLLYRVPGLGCGPHWTLAVELHVRADGEITELGRKPAFRDRAMDNLCLD